MTMSLGFCFEQFVVLDLFSLLIFFFLGHLGPYLHEKNEPTAQNE